MSHTTHPGPKGTGIFYCYLVRVRVLHLFDVDVNFEIQSWTSWVSYPICVYVFVFIQREKGNKV